MGPPPCHRPAHIGASSWPCPQTAQHWSSEPLRTCLPRPTASCWASHQPLLLTVPRTCPTQMFPGLKLKLRPCCSSVQRSRTPPGMSAIPVSSSDDARTGDAGCRDHVIQVPARGGPATQTVLATPLAENTCGGHQPADTPSDRRICWAGGGSERAGQDLSLKRTWVSAHTEAVPKPLQHPSPGLPAPSPSIPPSASE